MALIKCPHCGKDISNKATICPHCKEKNKTPGININMLIGIIAIVAIAIVTFILLQPKSKTKPKEETLNEYANSNFKVKYPNNVSFTINDKNEYYFYPQGKGIPYVMIYHFEGCKSPDSCIQELKTSLSKKYSDLKSTEIEKVKKDNKEFTHITMTYKVEGYEVTDNRYFKNYDGEIWGITSKEVKSNNDDVSNVLDKIIETFEVK